MTEMIHFCRGFTNLRQRSLKGNKIGYKDTFMARLYTLTTCGADIWKQKFVKGLPHYISKKFYQTMTANSINQQIDWANLTYEDISSTVQMICVNLCTENKHTTKVIKDSDYRKELGTFYRVNALTIDEETKQSLLYAIRSDDDTSSQTESSSEEDYINILQEEGSSSEEEFYSQSDSSDDEGAIPCTGRCAEADQNVIQEGLVPSKYFEKTKESLSGAGGNPLNIQFKLSKVHICKGDVCLVNTFILVKNLNEGIILGTPFLTQLYPFHVIDKGIVSKKFDKEITFEFTHLVTPKYISNIEEEVRQFINRIARKEKQIKFLQDDIKTCKVAIEIQKPPVQSKIQNFQKQLKKEVCSNLPNGFWDRKKHMVTLPYEDEFKEAQIPTKARPIQMNKDLVKAEKERGVPRLVINYKPFNKVLKWIRYLIPIRQDLLKRITLAKVFSKFDMKSGFWQIQIHPADRYKTAFNVPFGQFQWNVMPLGLKNASSEFQKIMNDIFNQYQEFTIVYIDDVLVFSNTVDQHFKHLRVFLNVIKSNGLVVSQPKIKLFQTKIRFLDEQAKLIIDTDASDIGYGGILKQEFNEKISIVRYHSGIWNSAQKNHSTIKKEVLAIVLSVQKFQGDLINKEFLVRTDSKASKFIFEKDVKNFISKQIFARWQTILSCFDFKIEPIKGSENSLAGYLSREHLLKTTSSALNPQPNGTAFWPATATKPAATAAKQSKQ
ncbi:Enzymatic polyprotein [Cucumis melo var. makuwa]|uniref:Enzymatic polyprotein n=1 Tax=Cucumis melo var. makuwa TaxID=1194695 RepID=A0A5A7VGY5_CUCMM|nr:Enzymatic polyprotein [Cucumis melo var. makuwa]TYK00925.1 Enzymatic polyprotein [Cucumis melo var. makuwa]